MVGGSGFSNQTATDLELEAIDPVGVDGLDVLGVRVTLFLADGTEPVTNGGSWPPGDAGQTPPAGVILRGTGRGISGAVILVGVRHQAGVPTGTIQGLRIRYRAGDSDYEVIYHWSLKIRPAA